MVCTTEIKKILPSTEIKSNLKPIQPYNLPVSDPEKLVTSSQKQKREKSKQKQYYFHKSTFISPKMQKIVIILFQMNWVFEMDIQMKGDGMTFFTSKLMTEKKTTHNTKSTGIPNTEQHE